jgi:hypothetical protein
MKKLSLSRAVKVCVASRPYNVFVNSFGENPDRTFYIHDFTDWNIRQYITKVFEGDAAFISRKTRDPEGYRKLTENIRRDANGVFLWVYLVILQLLDGLQNADRMSDLQKRIDKLSEDLRSLFSLMLNTVEEDYHEQQAQMLLVACHTKAPLSLIGFSFLDEEDPDFALNCPLEDIPFEAAQTRCEGIRKRLVARCRLLLEPVTDRRYPFDFRVTFLHRTDRDYLSESEAQQLLKSRLRTAFDQNKVICNALLAQLKLRGPDSLGVKEWQYWKVNGPVHDLVTHFMRQVKDYEHLNGLPLGIHVNQVETTVRKRKGPERTFSWWSDDSVVPGRSHPRTMLSTHGDSWSTSAFLKIIVKHELSLYLNWHFDLSPLQDLMPPMQVADLLRYCLSLYRRMTSVEDGCLNSSVVKAFLDHGANPNAAGPDCYTPWQHFMSLMYVRGDQLAEPELFPTLEYLILRGADPFYDSAEKIIEQNVSPDNARYLNDLLREQRKLRKGKTGWYSLLWKGLT